MTGIELIAAERQGQIGREGWSAEHDDAHDRGEMAHAARCYALPGLTSAYHAVAGWPWGRHWWKPSDDPVRNLVKAGALIAAEIDRLQRAAANIGRTGPAASDGTVPPVVGGTFKGERNDNG